MNNLEIRKLLDFTEISDQTYFPIDGLDQRYNINKKGVIWDHYKNKPIFPYWKNSKLRHDLYINNRKISFSVFKLYLMAFMKMNTDLETYINKLSVIVYDREIKHPTIDNLIWLIPNGGVECLKYKGYYSINGNPDIVVSKDYIFLNYKTGKQYSISIPDNTTRYPQVGVMVKREICLRSTTKVHRLVAFAFLPVPLAKESLLVNHKDGNKNNYNLENLEWCTYTENNLHAIKNNLKTDNIPVIAVNINTSEKKYFFSFQEAARVLNIHAWTISQSKKLYKEEGIVKTAPWIFLDIDDHVPVSFKRIKQNIATPYFTYFKITNQSNNKIDYIKNKRNLFRYFKTEKISELLTNINFEYNGYLVESINKDELPLGIFKPVDDKRGGKLQKQIRVTDRSNNAVITYGSTDEFAALVGAKRKTIQHSMHLRNGVWQNFKIEYLD